MAKVCIICGKRAYSDYCVQHKPRKPIKTNKLPNKVGRIGKATAKAVTQWKRTQAPNHQGYYECYICHKWIPYLTAEHTKSKARHPECRTDTSKLKPVCNDCNAEKGSHDN